jgi:hypothetical protein
MPHVHGGIPRSAVVRVVDAEAFAREVERAPDDVAEAQGTELE